MLFDDSGFMRKWMKSTLNQALQSFAVVLCPGTSLYVLDGGHSAACSMRSGYAQLPPLRLPPRTQLRATAEHIYQHCGVRRLRGRADHSRRRALSTRYRKHVSRHSIGARPSFTRETDNSHHLSRPKAYSPRFWGWSERVADFCHLTSLKYFCQFLAECRLASATRFRLIETKGHEAIIRDRPMKLFHCWQNFALKFCKIEPEVIIFLSLLLYCLFFYVSFLCLFTSICT